MRILLCHRPQGAFGYITDGWVNAFRDLGHIVQRWDGTEESWHSFDPDLHIACSGHKQPIPHNRRAKVAIHVNPCGPIKINGIDEEETTIRWVLNQNPDAVFGYGFEADRIYWSNWTNIHKIKWIPMPTAADVVVFKPLSIDKIYDVVYLGGKWAYKGIMIDKYLMPLLKSGVNYKLHGWGDWHHGICSGPLSDDQANPFLNSGKIGPCISEGHTHTNGIDIPERIFKLGAIGVLSISDPVPGMTAIIESAVVATNPDAYVKLSQHYISNDKDRLDVAKAQQAEVLAKHTYHHRVTNLLKTMGF